MTALAEFVVKLRAAADIEPANDKAAALVEAANGLEAAVAAFNPTVDLDGGVRELVTAISRAHSTYLRLTGKTLVKFGAVTAEKPMPSKSGEPPEAA